MRKIELTQGRVAIVDDCDYDYLKQWKWHCNHYGYAVRSCGLSKKPSSVYMHRAILERVGVKHIKEVDHVNRNRLDNRRENLRSASPSQNRCNQGKLERNTSGYKGVSWFKTRNCWRSTIYVKGRQKHLGYYDDLEEAARAYNKAACIYHGEFAVLNEVPNE